MRFMIVLRCGEVLIYRILHHLLSMKMYDGGAIVSMSVGLRRSWIGLRLRGSTMIHGGVVGLSDGCVGILLGACLVADNMV